MSGEAHEELLGLERWLDQWEAHVRTRARGCARGGDATWDEVLASLGVAPLPAAEREAHLRDGPKQRAGALPIEVRWVAQKLHDQAHARCRELDLKITGGDEVVDRIERRLADFVDETVRGHLQALVPPTTTSSIFANALASTPDYNAMSGGGGAMTLTRKCTVCGAPQKKDEASAVCVYCGGGLK